MSRDYDPPKAKIYNPEQEAEREHRNSDDGWAPAGYISKTRSKKGCKMRIDGDWYFVSLKSLKAVLRENQDYATIKEIPERGTGKAAL